MKEKIKKILSDSQQQKIRSFRKRTSSFFSFGNLNKIAIIHGTDKWGSHWYTQHYHAHFKKYKDRAITLLEIGVGGYDTPHHGGNSLRTWKSYFSKAKIYGVDLYDKAQLEEKRIRIFQGSQVDETFLKSVIEKTGAPDIIIDDGSHLNNHVVTTFKLLFPSLKANGLYVVEDIETAYWPEYGGTSENLQTSATSMNFFKGLTDGLNHSEFIRPDYKPSYFDLNITSITFYHNMVFIQKGNNDEKSVNIVSNNHHRLDSKE